MRRLAGLQVDRRERLHQRRQRLHRGTHDNVLPVGDAGLDAAGAVRLPVQPALVADDLVVRLRAAQPGEREAVAHLHPLHGLDPHQRSREARVEPLVLARVRAETRRHAASPHLDHAAEGVALTAGRVHRGGVGARLRQRRAVDPDADLREQRLRNRARGDVSCGVTRRGTFQRVAHIGQPELLGSGQVGVAGPRERHLLRPLALRLALGRPGAHPPRPVPVVAVADDERERRAERAPVPQPGEHLHLVRLDLLARRAPVALLAAPEVGVDRRPVEDEARRQARDDRDERRPVRLAGRCQVERHGGEPRAARGPARPGRCAAAGLPRGGSRRAGPTRAGRARSRPGPLPPARR